MLSRAADNLYWMARYIERAENMARILDVSWRMSLLPTHEGEAGPWQPALIIAGAEKPFAETGKPVDAANVIRFLALDADNPSSIRSCLRAARENAHAMRAQITTEMWEAMNATWLEAMELDYAKLEASGFRPFFDWVKDRSHLFRGVTYGTLLRDEAFNFIRVGTFLERADSTARILDVKYHVLLPSVREVGGAVDYYQWAALLRSVSSLRAYRKVYKNAITPRRVAELLILRGDMPRSLLACFTELTENLSALRDLYRRDYESTRLALAMHSRLKYGAMEDVFTQGLHEYLTDFIDSNVALGNAIHRDFMM
jgi:uncharacterized alpha-E superfamily protein